MNLQNATRYHEGLFPPEKIHYEPIINELLAAEQALARFDQMLKNLHNSEILLAPLRNQEAVLSSRMEGTISTIDEIMEFEANVKEDHEDTYNMDVRSDVIETLLYQRSLRNAQKGMEAGYQISDSLIKQIHQQLLSFGRGASKSPGAYKTEQNFIGDQAGRQISYVPIEPEKLQDGMERLFTYLKSNTHPVLIRTALMHLEFEALHPFKDGNGRIGRMLITLFLWQQQIISAPHFYISGYLEEHKDAYINRMREVSKTGNWEQWCAFFLTAVKEQATQNLEIAEQINRLYEDMKLRVSGTLASKWSMQVLDYIFTYPKFRLPNLYRTAGIPEKSASTFIKKLLDEGLLYLQQEAAGRKSALYSFEPLMRLVRV
ncbi:Fic family protein [Niabella drilacis]|uniref:Fic family protein n=1 Tax=Niabella drilacis (strain DSM 25811 / CCM 8410 / CCUG 62505 / LMG 26954 / E90) TaxID=1285928 RepID=A0A1G6QCR7_NIADE|nr:Fic family protein [Niabella drilacis]SDC90169.1 Fic family protein [Niabella drilacis]